MKKSEYVKFAQFGKHVRSKKDCSSQLGSITDPSFAQTGRQMLANPILQDVRVSYNYNGGLNPENPHEFNEFDRINGDKFLASEQAKRVINQAVQQQKAQQQAQQQSAQS